MTAILDIKSTCKKMKIVYGNIQRFFIYSLGFNQASIVWEKNIQSFSHKSFYFDGRYLGKLTAWKKISQKTLNIYRTIHCHVAAINILAHFYLNESSNRQLKKFLFLVTTAILNGGRGCWTEFWTICLITPCHIEAVKIWAHFDL